MIIKETDLITDRLPEVEKDKFGYRNVVLAVRKDSLYCEENLYLPPWGVVNTEFYIANKSNYKGWIGLEFLTPPEELSKKAF